MPFLLLLSVFVIATCGLIYELIAGTLASYLLGDSITQFSTVIGTYLFAMGIGSFLSKFINRNLVPTFIRVELLIGLVGGFSAAVLFLAFEYTSGFRFLLYGQVALTGILVGLEIPLLMRIMQDRYTFKDLVSNIFTFDYIGALAASILFPMVLVPQLGLLRTGFFFGLLNTAIAIWGIYLFRDHLSQTRFLKIPAAVTALALVAGFIWSGSIMKAGESAAFPGNIIFAKSTPYQRIILTRQKDDLRLFLNGNLQFSSRDEYRYHEALVHPPMATALHHNKVLVMGGGDGLALREILKYPDVDSILLVDLDPAMTQLFTKRSDLSRLNQQSFAHPKVRVINADAFSWIRDADSAQWDVAIIDFPDPSNFSIGKLYSQSFYNELRRILKPDGVGVIQSTSPFFAPKSFWCINKTVASAGFETVPYHCYVPSFGEWGYVMLSAQPIPPNMKLPEGLKFFSTETFRQMVQFPPDMKAEPEEINKLNNQALVLYFEKEWGRYVD